MSERELALMFVNAFFIAIGFLSGWAFGFGRGRKYQGNKIEHEKYR